MSALDVGDSRALEAALEAVPEGHWAEVETNGATFLVVRVPGGWCLPGDVVMASADVVEGQPSRVEVLGSDGHLPAEEAIVLARTAFERARAEGDAGAAETLTREMEDLDSVGWAEAGRLRDEAQAWLDAEDGLTPEQREWAARSRAESPGEATERAIRALRDDR